MHEVSTGSDPDLAPLVALVMGTGAPQLAERAYYAPMASYLRRLGLEVQCFSLPKLGIGDFDDMVVELEDKIFAANPYRAVTLIGHSQGASAVHALAHIQPERVRSVFEMCPPTHGTWLANQFLARGLGLAQHLGLHSERLRDLRSQRAFPANRIHAIYSPFDQLIIPFTSSQVRDAHNVVIAPRSMHGLLAKHFGQRRSLGVTLIHGYIDHITAPMSPIVLDYMAQVMSTPLEEPKLRAMA